MRRLVLLGFFSLGIATTLMLGLVTAPPVTAAQQVAATLYRADSDDFQLRGFAAREGYRIGMGLEISFPGADGKSFPGADGKSFPGADGKTQSVRVYLPKGFAKLSRLPVRFNDAHTGTYYYECEADEIAVPTQAGAVSSKTCSVFASGGSDLVTMLVQTFPKSVQDFGGSVSEAIYSVYVSVLSTGGSEDSRSVFPNPDIVVDTTNLAEYTVPGLASPLTTLDAALLQAYPRWSKFYSGTRARSATKHFPILFGSLTFAGVGVYGPGNSFGSPTNEFGRNVYIDTFDSDYGRGWRRVMGVLTQRKNGTFCYEFSKKGGSKGKTGVSRENLYRMTVIGPSLTPVLSQKIKGPKFDYGGPNYKPLKEKWGTNFSTAQASALRQQALMMGPEWRRPVTGTDCAKTLRQLPDSFFTQPE
jgi:hypothetical protein